MKISEAVDLINGTRTAKVLAVEDDLFISDTGESSLIWFLVVPKRATNWGQVKKDYRWLRSVEPVDLARVMDAVQRLLDTPVKDRGIEKKYRLVANPDTLKNFGTSDTKYVARIESSVDRLIFRYGIPTVYSESTLKEIEKVYPNFAPAIETMKEEVKDDE